MKIFYPVIAFFLTFFAFTHSTIATGPMLTDYEKYYPKYIDSKEPLSILESKDKQPVKVQTILPLITINYGSHNLQQLDVYTIPSLKVKPVIFFIHAMLQDKSYVSPALPIWLSLGYEVVSINYRSIPESPFLEMIEDCNMALKWVINNIQTYGGDPNRIAITGISCGAYFGNIIGNRLKGA
jgi:acetyl esterase/lipase